MFFIASVGDWLWLLMVTLPWVLDWSSLIVKKRLIINRTMTEIIRRYSIVVWAFFDWG